jgi:hypothetical protein
MSGRTSALCAVRAIGGEPLARPVGEAGGSWEGAVPRDASQRRCSKTTPSCLQRWSCLCKILDSRARGPGLNRV